MNAQNQFDRLLTSVLEERGVPRDPDYLGEVFNRTRRMRQRPAWSSPGRWLPMNITMPRLVVPRATPILVVLALLLLATLVVMALLGSRPRLPAPFGPAAAGQLAFDSKGDILVVAPNGTGLTKLISGPAETLRQRPAWSRDGTRIAYMYRSAQDPLGLWVADADGTNAHKVSREIPISLDRGPAATWSPSGRLLAFATNNKLYVVNADGSVPPRALGDDSVLRSDPVWSPKETLIAFRGQEPGNLMAIVHVIRPDGQGQTRVGEGAWHDWSPDGTRLVYGVGAEPLGNIVMATFDGATWTESTLVGGTGDDVMPRWSNDGTRVAFLRCLGPRRACLLHTAAVDTGASPVLVADETESLGFARPCWSPDDRFIVALSGTPGADQQAQSNTSLVLYSVDQLAPPIRLPAPDMNGVDACSWQRVAP